jgi:hypothetical protein
MRITLPLPLDIDRAHIDHAFEPEPRAWRCGGDAVLTRAGLGDDALCPCGARP